MSRFSVLLCRAASPGNVGSVCRAMKTMGILDLVLADCPDYDEIQVATMAVHADDVYRSAKRFPDLPSALADFSLSAGFTRRRGEKRKSLSLSARDFARNLPGGKGRIALVFGNEKDGLSDEELGLCSRAVHIPSSDAFPSMNLSHAVQVACYELFVEELRGRDGSADPATRADTDAATAEIAVALEGIGFFQKSGDESCRAFLRDLAERAGLGKAELDRLRLLFLKTAAMAGGGGSPRRHASRGKGSSSS